MKVTRIGLSSYWHWHFCRWQILHRPFGSGYICSCDIGSGMQVCSSSKSDWQRVAVAGKISMGATAVLDLKAMRTRGMAGLEWEERVGVGRK